MLASAVRAYLNRFGVAVGRKVAIYTATDDGWLTARDLIKAGLTPVAVIDARAKAPAEFADVAKAVPVVAGGAVVATQRRQRADRDYGEGACGDARLRRRRARRFGRLQSQHPAREPFWRASCLVRRDPELPCQ